MTELLVRESAKLDPSLPPPPPTAPVELNRRSSNPVADAMTDRAEVIHDDGSALRFSYEQLAGEVASVVAGVVEVSSRPSRVARTS